MVALCTILRKCVWRSRHYRQPTITRSPATKHGRISMPRKLPPFVECWRDRHRKVRVYFRKDRGVRIPLPSVIGSPEFTAAYQDALAGRLSETTPKRRVAAAPGTIEALIRSYMASAEYRSLRATTKTGYASR